MPAKTRTFTFKRQIAAPPADVYRAFTNATLLRDWLCNAAQADPRPGGRLYVYWARSGEYACGEYTALVPDRRVAFTWRTRSAPAETRVTVVLDERDGGTLVTVRHAGVGSGAKWAEEIDSLTRGWPAGLEDLQFLLETGLDRRIARRPMLGLSGGDDVTPALAAARGLHPTTGLWVAGTVPGFGAHAAGLGKDDVIVRFAGKPVPNWAALQRVLGSFRAGDKVKIVYWRGHARHTATLELSARPQAQYPATAEELVEATQRGNAGLNAGLAEILAGVTDAEADHRPAPGEWTVNELVAHFIACERDLESYFAALMRSGNLSGEVDDSLEFRPNVDARLAAIVGRYPTLPALLEELKRCQAETLAFIAAFPADFITRKAFYNRAAFWATVVIPGHLDEHRDQFTATIAAARSA